MVHVVLRPRPVIGKYVKALRVAASIPLYGMRRDKLGYASWLRAELEEAGCLFIKIGQWISSRTDIFPAEVTAAFSSLQKDVSPMPAADVRRTLAEEGHMFDAFDEAPISCGSIAQVHRGVYRGRDVAIKVQRPGLRGELREDLDIVRHMLFPLRLTNRKSYDDAVKSLEDLGTTILRETDFQLEEKSMRVFAAFFTEPTSLVRIPEVLFATPRVVVMEYVPSAAVSGAHATCQTLMQLFLTQFLELGYVHTDMHAGNLGVDAAGRLVMYDFGSVLHCPDELRECFKRLVVSYLNRNPAIMLDYMLEYDVLKTDGAITAEQREVLEQFMGTVLEYAETADIRSFDAGVRAIPVPASLPVVEFRPEVFMVLRSFTLLEGLCKELDPDFVIVDGVLASATMLLADPEIYRMKIDDDLRAVAKAFGA